jgi:hypothetical protein
MNLIVAMPLANREVERMTVRLNDNVPFDALQTVLAGEADFAIRPFFDFTRLAS